MLESIPGWVFITGVSLLIATIAYSSQLFILLPAMEWWSPTAAKLLIPFNLLVLMVYYNYYLACTTDPGRVPSGWEPPYSTFQNDDSTRWQRQELPATDTGMTGPRYCKQCKHYKPPRAHHCRYCRRCVLKMDHHCPWIANCVGYDNYGHFVRFVLYVDIACGYALGLLGWRVSMILDDIRHFRWNAEPSTMEVVFLVINFILAFVVIFCVGILSVYHLYCMSRNQSSVESWERSKVKTLIRRGKIMPVHYPFDVGLYRNICSVLGNNPLLWLWPQNPTSDGLTFPVRPGTDPRLPYCWPPRDPDDLRPSIFSNRYKRKQQREMMRNNNNANSHRLVRRDSEGYLVREITMEERMAMLQPNYQEQGDHEQQLQHENDGVQDEHLERLDAHQDEVDSVEDYYDSGSCISEEEVEYTHYYDDLEQQQRQQLYPMHDTRWMESKVYDLSGGDYYDDSGSSWDEAEDQDHRRPMVSRKHYPAPVDDDHVDEDEDNVPLMPYPKEKSRPLPPTHKDVKED
ncbi:hypothetical protein LRAMOSA07282 [Lichtheimia ramosa]|uniref:Palmitoyltransferase PFA4 n=1 Tax=Lichtheimia ramosa TaxID=688394 RepID=A0A077WDP6_9FUNG|nr:hypothetical protein LRAMOSA07282 [Lichtheimia ramosa]